MLYPIELRARSTLSRERMAERRGFEPPDRFYPINRLAGGCLQPLGHLSAGRLAEGVGFEPTEPCGSAVFKTAALDHSAIPPRDRRVKVAVELSPYSPPAQGGLRLTCLYGPAAT